MDAEASGRESPQRYPDKVNLGIAEGTTNDRGAQGHLFGKTDLRLASDLGLVASTCLPC